jgi:hypothetical protein
MLYTSARIQVEHEQGHHWGLAQGLKGSILTPYNGLFEEPCQVDAVVAPQKRTKAATGWAIAAATGSFPPGLKEPAMLLGSSGRII